MKAAFLKRTGISSLAIFFPWIIMLMDDNLGGALVALLLQATGIGWIPASTWAWKVAHEKFLKQPRQHKPASE